MLFSIATFAQQGNKMTAEQRAELRMKKIDAVCALTPEQETKVKALFTTQISSRTETGGKKTPEQRKALQQKRKAANQKFQSDLKATLTANQQAKWEAHKKEQAAKRKK